MKGRLGFASENQEADILADSNHRPRASLSQIYEIPALTESWLGLARIRVVTKIEKGVCGFLVVVVFRVARVFVIVVLMLMLCVGYELASDLTARVGCGVDVDVGVVRL